jgi:hypothetical protein
MMNFSRVLGYLQGALAGDTILRFDKKYRFYRLLIAKFFSVFSKSSDSTP